MGFDICQSCEVSVPVGATLCKRCERAELDYFDDYEPTREEEDAAEIAYLNYQARLEWDHYHPGEPCPAIELPYPSNGVLLDPAPERTGSPSQAQTAFEQTPNQQPLTTEQTGGVGHV